jgi:hypothetical protein
LKSHLLRTHASDLVEIYVSHGLFPRHEENLKESHPGLMERLEEQNEDWPIQVIMDYIMEAIHKGKIDLGTTYAYDKSGRLVENIMPVMPESGGRPKTREIRCLYKLKSAKYSHTRSVMKQMPFKDWLQLPEVVNVILFGVRDPWIKQYEKPQYIYWSPDISITKKAKSKKSSPDKKKQKTDDEESKKKEGQPNKSIVGQESMARSKKKKDEVESDDEESEGGNAQGSKLIKGKEVDHMGGGDGELHQVASLKDRDADKVFEMIKDLIFEMAKGIDEKGVQAYLGKLADLKNWGIALALYADVQHSVISLSQNNKDMLSLAPGAIDNLDAQGLMKELDKYDVTRKEEKEQKIVFDNSGGTFPVNVELNQQFSQFSSAMAQIISKRTGQENNDLLCIAERTTNEQRSSKTERLYEQRRKKRKKTMEI